MTLLEKEWFIQAPWGRLCIVAWGDCLDPPVLVCHGTKDSAASFRPLIRVLPRKFYYIGMELPGSGKSDPMPPGMMLSLYDLVYSVQLVVRHFRWDSFIFLGHSMGCSLGYTYNLSYPGKISKVIQLDPLSISFVVPADKFTKWYQYTFKNYFDNYDRYNSRNNQKPKYTKQDAIDRIVSRRGFTKQLAEETLERVSEPAGDGLIRFTFDERVEVMTYPPVTQEYIKTLITNIKSHTLTVIAEDSKEKYEKTPFLFDENSFPGNNYRVRVVKGNHDVHVIHPERVASFVAQFLLYGVDGLDNKAKL